VKWNCDVIDVATNNTTESPVFFCSVNNTSAAAHKQSLVLLSFFSKYVLTNKILSLPTQAVTFVEILQISSNWTATQLAYLIGVTGNICFVPTHNATILPRLCVVERNAWSINKHFRYELHNLHIVYKRPASWLGGQGSWLLTMRSRVRFPALPCAFFLERGRRAWGQWSG